MIGFRSTALGCLAAGLSLLAGTAGAAVYEQDFEGAVVDLSPFATTGPALQVTADQSAPARHVLGSAEPLGSGLFNANETVTLTLPGVAPGAYTLAFDFFAIYTWDGDGSGCCGPDWFDVTINGATVLHAWFNQTGLFAERQDELALSFVYPDDGRPDESPQYDPGDTITLGNTAYRMAFDFTHPGGALVVGFIGGTDQAGQQNYNTGVPDEPWALDAISVTQRVPPVPLPATLPMLGVGLAALGLMRRVRAAASRR